MSPGIVLHTVTMVLCSAISYHSRTETIEDLKASGRFWDNDSLAMVLAKQLQADLLVGTPIRCFYSEMQSCV